MEGHLSSYISSPNHNLKWWVNDIFQEINAISAETEDPSSSDDAKVTPEQTGTIGVC